MYSSYADFISQINDISLDSGLRSSKSNDNNLYFLMGGGLETNEECIKTLEFLNLFLKKWLEEKGCSPDEFDHYSERFYYKLTQFIYGLQYCKDHECHAIFC